MRNYQIILRNSIIISVVVFSTLYFISLQTDLLQLFRHVDRNKQAVTSPRPKTPSPNWHSADFCPSFLASSGVWNAYNFSQVPTFKRENNNNGYNFGVKKTLTDLWLGLHQVIKTGNLEVFEQSSDESDESTCEGLPSFPLEPCDEECTRFQAMLKKWPTDKPKSVIYLLTQVSRMAKLKQSLSLLDKHFNLQFRYPIVLFYDDVSFDNATLRRDISSSVTGNNTYFQKIKFASPPYVNLDRTSKNHCPRFPIGYRHMCRFHALGIYQQPILNGLEYLWRLDDDSLITHPIKYDVFKYMQNRKLVYGYNLLSDDSHECVQGLWEAACTFARNELSKIEFYAKWPRARIYYNNFEISDFRLWKSCNYRKYIDYVDRLGGIYYLRWGDAPIKTIAVSLFVPESQVHWFGDIGYQHQMAANVPKR